MSKHPRNTDGLIAYGQSKSLQKEQDVDSAIRSLIKDQRPINFNSVANAAKVTKAYLYNHPAHRERIEQLRLQQMPKKSDKGTRQNVSDNSKDIIIAAKTRRIRELELENKELKLELEHLRGKIYHLS